MGEFRLDTRVEFQRFDVPAAGVVPDGFFTTPLKNWKVEDAWPDFIPDLALDRVDPSTLNLPKLYTSVATLFPTASFAQFNTRSDQVQTFFYILAKGTLTFNDQ